MYCWCFRVSCHFAIYVNPISCFILVVCFADWFCSVLLPDMVHLCLISPCLHIRSCLSLCACWSVLFVLCFFSCFGHKGLFVGLLLPYGRLHRTRVVCWVAHQRWLYFLRLSGLNFTLSIYVTLISSPAPHLCSTQPVGTYNCLGNESFQPFNHLFTGFLSTLRC